MDRRSFLTGAVSVSLAATSIAQVLPGTPMPTVVGLDVGTTDASWIAVAQMDTNGVWHTLATREVVGDIDTYMDGILEAAKAA